MNSTPALSNALAMASTVRSFRTSPRFSLTIVPVAAEARYCSPAAGELGAMQAL
jgi:hypothetical protein